MKLAQRLNRTVLVSIPAFFGDGDARTCTLIDVESAGLWLACDELRDQLRTPHEISPDWTAPVTGFFPFSQILYAVDPSQFAVLARGPHKPTRPGAPAPSVTKDASREQSHREGRLKQKDSKGRR